jgi:hypothetical protein
LIGRSVNNVVEHHAVINFKVNVQEKVASVLAETKKVN